MGLGVGAFDVADEFVAAVGLDIDIDIGHAATVGVEEALEEQFVLDRIDAGDPQAVRGQAIGGAAASTDADAHPPGRAHDVVDAEEELL